MVNVSYYCASVLKRAFVSYERFLIDGFADPPNAQGIMGPRATRYRAASLARAAMLYRRSLKRGEVPAEGTKDAPLCMETYRCVS